MKVHHRVFVLLVLLAVCSPSLVVAEEDVRITPDVVYGHKVGMALTMDVLQPTEDANGAGLLFMVSGGWRSSWSPPEAAAKRFSKLLDAGFTVFVVRHGSSPKFILPEIVDDVRRAVRYVKLNAERFDVDPNRLGVFGGSAGGHLSLMLATASDEGDSESEDEVERTSSRVAAVVAYYPPTDLVGLVPTPPARNERYPAINFDPQRAEEFSPLWHVTPDDPPTLLIHGDKDVLVPLKHSEQILEQLQEHEIPAELIVIEGAAHGFQDADADRAAAALLDWFKQHLAAEPQ